MTASPPSGVGALYGLLLLAALLFVGYVIQHRRDVHRRHTPTSFSQSSHCRRIPPRSQP